MRLFLMVLRSFLGVATFNLPLQYVPHKQSGKILVVCLACVAVFFHIALGDIFEALLFLLFTTFILIAGPPCDDLSKPSLIVSIGYIVAVSELISLLAIFITSPFIGVEQGTEIATSTNWMEISIRLWQAIVVVLYIRVLSVHNQNLIKVNSLK